MDLATLERLNTCRRARVAAVLLTDLDGGDVSVIAESSGGQRGSGVHKA